VSAQGQEMGAAQAAAPQTVRKSSRSAEATADILGIPDEVRESVFNTPELARIQICRAAELILENHSTTIKDTDVRGRSVTYRVSLGNEHFPVKKGILETTLEANGVMPGFNLRQVVDKNNQDMQPIYLVTGDVVEKPIVTIMPASGEVYEDSSLIEPLHNAEDLRKISEIISAIGQDSKERHDSLRQTEEYKKQASKRKLRKRVARAIGATTVAVGLWFGAPKLNETYQTWETERTEQQAEQKAADRANALQQEAEAKQAREDRETAIRSFDLKQQYRPVYSTDRSRHN
jgi:hypothetical protein